VTEHPVVHENVSLKALNGFGIDVAARFLVRIESVEELQAVLENTQLPSQRLILGGGSNVLFLGDYDGLVLHVAIKGRQFSSEDDDFRYVSVGAGENWHELVRWTVEQGLGGLENLSLIPGKAGAAPIQNIGAYGVELSQRFHELSAVRLGDGATSTMDATACEFSYRDSVFKDPATNDLLIASLVLKLPKRWEPVLGYRGLDEQLKELGIEQPDPRAISDAVCTLRKHKLPDPAVLGNAGSFFKNPTVDRDAWNELQAVEPKIVAFPEQQGQIKIAAASLIELCGWKGYREGDAGVSDKHALILVNHGDATGAQVHALARRIRDSVEERFHIRLEPEPVIIGAKPTF